MRAGTSTYRILLAYVYSLAPTGLDKRASFNRVSSKMCIDVTASLKSYRLEVVERVCKTQEEEEEEEEENTITFRLKCIVSIITRSC